MVEIKNRKRATSPAMASSFTRRDDWLDPISPDALPQRDVHEGLTVAPAQSQALREAEKVFQGLRGSGQTAPAESEPTTAAISSESEAVTPRVLPDLRTAAREAKREDVRQPRRNGAANRSTEGQPVRRSLLSRSGFLPLDLSSSPLRPCTPAITLRRLWRSVVV